jgi:hypothetical protein
MRAFYAVGAGRRRRAITSFERYMLRSMYE